MVYKGQYGLNNAMDTYSNRSFDKGNNGFNPMPTDQMTMFSDRGHNKYAPPQPVQPVKPYGNYGQPKPTQGMPDFNNMNEADKNMFMAWYEQQKGDKTILNSENRNDTMGDVSERNNIGGINTNYPLPNNSNIGN